MVYVIKHLRSIIKWKEIFLEHNQLQKKGLVSKDWDEVFGKT